MHAQKNKVGSIGTLYTVSYYNNQPAVNAALQDTWVPIDTYSQAFCVGATLTSLGDAFEWGGDNECVGECPAGLSLWGTFICNGGVAPR